MELLFITRNKKEGEMAVRNLLSEKPDWSASLTKIGPEASRELQKNNFDAAIVEVSSSNGVGFDMISELKVTHPTMPVIPVSSSFTNGVVEKSEMYCDHSNICDISDMEDCINTLERNFK